MLAQKSRGEIKHSVKPEADVALRGRTGGRVAAKEAAHALGLLNRAHGPQHAAAVLARAVHLRDLHEDLGAVERRDSRLGRSARQRAGRQPPQRREAHGGLAAAIAADAAARIGAHALGARAARPAHARPRRSTRGGGGEATTDTGCAQTRTRMVSNSQRDDVGQSISLVNRRVHRNRP